MNERSTPDENLWAALEGSLVGRALAAIRVRIDAARRGSMSAAAATSMANEWHASSPLIRMRAIGAMLIAVVVVHVALMLSVHPADAWWAIVPALVGGFGITITALSFAANRR